MTKGQESLRYTDAKILGIVQFTSPQLTSPRASEKVRADLRRIVEETAAERLAPVQARRDAVAALRVSGRHDTQLRARDAYLAYLNQRLKVLSGVSRSLRELYRPQPVSRRLLAEAREAVLAAGSSEDADQVKALLS